MFNQRPSMPFELDNEYFFGSVRRSRSANLYPPVTYVTSCPEHSNFIFLGQILKLLCQLSLTAQSQKEEGAQNTVFSE